MPLLKKPIKPAGSRPGTAHGQTYKPEGKGRMKSERYYALEQQILWYKKQFAQLRKENAQLKRDQKS